MDERGAPRRAVVIHVRDRDARQAELVERRLAGRGFAVDVADERGLYGIIRDPWIKRDDRENVRGRGSDSDGRAAEHYLHQGALSSRLPSPSVRMCSESSNTMV